MKMAVTQKMRENKHQSTAAVADEYLEMREGTKISAKHLSLRERNKIAKRTPTCS